MNISAERSDVDAELEILVQLDELRTEVARIRTELRCRRCTEPAPPPARWPGDPHARDIRPACSCGRQRAWPA
jgi:hypothetical protein